MSAQFWNCWKCEGTGRIDLGRGMERDCPECDGTGTENDRGTEGE